MVENEIIFPIGPGYMLALDRINMPFMQGERTNLDGNYRHWHTIIADNVLYDCQRHSSMLKAYASSISAWTPITYMKVVTEPAIPSSNSSNQDVAILASSYYDEIVETLTELEIQSDQPDPPVEKGALSTAKALIEYLRRARYAPPEISWQGGDAVVMLWAFNSATCAITVTDGEIGYVIRRDRKQHSLRSDIKIEDFDLLEVR